MYVIVAGCGRVGSRLAEFLSFERHDVVVIDRDSGSFRRLGGTFNGITMQGMAFDEEVLLEAGVKEADAFAAVTDEDNTNLMACEIAKGVFGVPMVISRLYSPEKELTFFKMNMDYVCSTTLITNGIRERLFQSEDTIIQQDRLDVGMQVVEFLVGEQAAGEPVGALDYGISSKVLLLSRDNRNLDFDQDTELQAGDRVVMTLRKEGWQTVTECLGPSADPSSCRADLLPVEGLGISVDAEGVSKAKVIVGGCSMVGAHLAYELSILGHDVTVIDEDPSLFRRLPTTYGGNFLEGVVYDEETLLAAGVEQADAFVSVTKKDNKNLMAAEVARHVFKVPHVMARMFNPDKEPTYQALGMPYVCGTTLVSNALIERILSPMVRFRAACLFNKYNLAEFDCPAAWDGKPVRAAMDNVGVKFAYIARRSSGYMPDDDFRLKKGDTINALVTTKKFSRLESNLRKISKG
jgi:trk/ktr system potassium uptake protein